MTVAHHGDPVKLSILMPIYNEEASALRALELALEVEFPCEVEFVVVDDGSTDGTPELLSAVRDKRVQIFTHPHNQGKGAAIATAAQHATGDYLVPLDADLEYDPKDIPNLLRPVMEGRTTVVYGSRTFGSHSAYSFWYVFGNKAITLVTNVMFNCYISDLETCFKLMPADLYREMNVRSRGFGMEAEITGKLLRRRIWPYDVPISYTARRREQGKKITWRDGVAALGILARERVRRVHAGQRSAR
jgi:glycosyltransferase involved in cell wall biosynthesis